MKQMLSSFEGIYLHKSGNDGREVTPVPIPNTEVKLSSADGSWDFVPVRVGRCQAKNLSQFDLGFFVFVYFNCSLYVNFLMDSILTH